MKRTIVLRVRDARTKAELRGVVAHAAHMLWQKGGWGHDPGDAPLAGAGDSPFALERQLLPFELLPLVVAAPGYAPELVEIGSDDDREKLVELAPPGSVEIEIIDLPARFTTQLRLVRIGATRRRTELEQARWLRSTLAFQTWATAGRTRGRFEGLAPGDWSAQLRATIDGVPFDAGMVAFKVDSGATASASLHARRDLDFPRRPVRGSVTVAKEWGVAASDEPCLARLECTALDESLGAAGRPDALERPIVATHGDARLTFDFGARWPGEYTLRIPRFEATHRVVVTAADGADTSHDLAVAPPADVELTVQLAGSDRPFDRARVAWSPVAVPCDDYAFFFNPRDGLAPDLESGRFRFRVPAGPIRISAALVRDDDEHLAVERIVTTEQDFDLVPGRNELSLELRPSFLLVVILRDGMENVPLPAEGRVAVERDGRAIDCEWTRTGDGHACLDLDEAGRYQVTVTQIAGYDDPALVSIEVSRRCRAAVVVPLRRRAPDVARES